MPSFSFGASFGAEPFTTKAPTVAQKAEQASSAREARFAALPPQVRARRGMLPLEDLEAMGEIARAYKEEGYCPVRLTAADLARALKTDTRDAEARLWRLIAAGAVEQTNRIAAAPVLRPVARTELTAKVEVISRKGDAVEVRTVPSIAPGATIGLRRREA